MVVQPGTKLKSLPKGTNFKGLKVKTDEGVVAYMCGLWSHGTFLSATPEMNRLYPIVVQDLKFIMNWEVTDDPVNLGK